MKVLMVIVGGNPISNYGIIKHSLNNNENNDILPKVDRVVLLYTDKTKNLVNNMKKLLDHEIGFIDINIKDKERSLKDIEQIVNMKLKEYEIDFIHLNYTGGTKSMSIGAFLAVENLKNAQKVFTDLDMSSKKLYLKRGDIYPPNGTIDDNINIKIEEILKLYNIEAKYNTDYSEFYSKDFARFLLNKNINHDEFFSKYWFCDFKELKKMNYKESLKNAPIDFKLDEIHNRKLKRLQKFIKGLWFEEYFYEFLKENQKEIGFDEIVRNLEKKDNNKSIFEVDIALIKGYDLYLFSCTTAKEKNIIKQKVFEAYKRSEELGGIGAKSVTVSLADEDTVNAIKKDDTNTYIGRNMPDIIGEKEILDKTLLKRKLKEIIK